MQPPLRDILCIRQYPTALEKATAWRRWVRSFADPRGAISCLAGHEITFFFPGYGRKIRTPHPALITKLNSGQITDIVDIGGGGALDPELQRGDFVLSTGEILSDSLQPLTLQRRDEVRAVAKQLAQKHEARFFEGTIFTSAAIIGSRSARLRLREQTGCAVVQMEHAWFLQALQQVMNPQAFRKLYVTHLEIVIDPVPRGDGWREGVGQFFRAMDYCVLRNQQHLGKLKAEFLKWWLEQAPHLP